ncbi:E3 ubiquitin-protein ligase RNF12-B-like [Phymastichus coffea]|uniref:E3 ubiquitin-protein ligase RNF12-B-like n=1 Tax=Phymastichus coffea TaxID=108790 RepID=UPI00273C8FAE|nr:E3 ubiquitin-protein ligase RNF12-B-like [Phymastichus coffea]
MASKREGDKEKEHQEEGKQKEKDVLNLVLATTLAVMASEASHDFSFDAPLHPIRPKLISESVGLNELPTKIIKIVRTVAVKVPVPYPVKIPHHIPVPVPVHHPVAVPVPQIVKVPHHVPVPVEKPVPVELPQQVPVFVSKPVPLPHPVPVPQPIAINRPVYIPVPKPLPYPVHHHEHEAHSVDVHASLYARESDFDTSHDGTENTQDEGNKAETQDAAASSHYFNDFRPSQPDFASPEQ